jgi:electron transfer flavoprotein beta subunit
MSQPRMVLCGDYSNDRGSGSVPSFIAADLDIDQALGLVALELPESANASFTAVRRLDGGRREQLLISGSAVLSVEGSTARLRRASLKNTMSASKQEIQVITATVGRVETPALRPYRPRPRVTLAPIGLTALERVKHITDTSSSKGHGETVHAEPSAAATLILESLRKWGYLP